MLSNVGCTTAAASLVSVVAHNLNDERDEEAPKAPQQGALSSNTHTITQNKEGRVYLAGCRVACCCLSIAPNTSSTSPS